MQEAFYADPRVLTMSIHESGEYLFPGTGFADETGSGEAKGACVNVPLPPFAGDEAILMAFERVVPPALRTFRPDILVTQIGADTHHNDPLTHLTATMALYPRLAAWLHDLVHECCAGPLGDRRWGRLRPGERHPPGVDGLHRHGAGTARPATCVCPRSGWPPPERPVATRPSCSWATHVPDYVAPIDRDYLTLLDSIERGALAQVRYLVDRRSAG